jgi:hypothetical protein
VLYVVNSTCIHMRTLGSNIYMYRGEYTKTLEKYNNREVYYTSNIPPQTHGGSRTLSLER